ncbi:glycosyltransferase [Acidithiobacillus sp. VAN18-1]|uniref:Glycosyltransferase n=1 Tax=Igneacidithiobacillus copahuensis TaxID=2724909 RepID=A0AAE2YMW3_9PROT|nr:glycosyltransferase [Igneacidithiobacillus copahuensis]MBU2787014.1 glycosyltransferase [Igneacidithiobacillus copahuensis]MBU2796845.1 glycosyltransferase [Acidithiobacillus sp. VAN18-2]
MRIVIEMQGAQTESRFRGIGRYTMAFAQAVVRNRGEHEIILALSGLFPDTIEPTRAAFDDLLPQENIRVWLAPGPVKEEQPGNESRRETAELLREAFLASLRPDIIHISSLFEGYVDDAVTSIGRFDPTTPVTVILYDLIPLLNPDHYLKPNPRYEQYYLRKIESLRHAASYLAISEFSRQEAIDALGIANGKAIKISTAIDSHFRQQTIDEATANHLRQKFGISRLFVLYTGGSDERKNLPRLIEAFAALPEQLRKRFQLLFAGKMPEGDIVRFKHLAKKSGLKEDELLFTGYISDDELIMFYNLCQLYVFPSWHEGFGLPALEAMACGAPVIGGNTSSLPEVIGLPEALFDPFDGTAISQKMAQALEDEAFRTRLREHGLEQAKKFSWDETAKRVIAAWEDLDTTQPRPISIKPHNGGKPRLAIVSPLPPERTGIADYSAELLPALAAHYDLELIVAQDRVDDPWVNLHGKVRDVAWLRANAGEIDRVLYQIGNSPFHRHMLPLLEEFPGTVVLHDFYLSGLMAWRELHGGEAGALTRALYESHGYAGVRDRYCDAEAAKCHHPVNWHILQHAQGVIVHSDYSHDLARQWYGHEAAADWKVIPLLRSPAGKVDKQSSRRQLGIDAGDFVVCSFGFLDGTKLNHRLLQAWLKSSPSGDKRCRLVFVGENHGGEYGASLRKTMRESGLGERLHITGFAAPEVFRNYLAAADLAVQLRTSSRGETSGTVLDCMNYGLPLIVNANGSMAELDREAVWMLPDEFSDEALVEALETLWRDPTRRQDLGAKARALVIEHHAPEVCAQRYADAIESFHQHTATAVPALLGAITAQEGFAPDDAALLRLSQTIAMSLPLPRPARRLFLDVTATCSNDLKTGIERVARAIIMALLGSPPAGYRVEPVYLSNAGGAWHYRYARNYTLELLGCPPDALEDETVEPENGDILLGLDISGDKLVRAEQAGLFSSYRNLGVIVYWMVHDLLPIRMPEVFPPGTSENHAQWLRAISSFDGAVCVSKTIADDLAAWRVEAGIDKHNKRPYRIAWSHHGADVTNSAPSTGMPDNAKSVLDQLASRPSFLMVGTIEPRKGHLQTIEAFTALWKEGVDVNLVIVGKEGWKDLPDSMRRVIPQTVESLRSHPELNKRLFWLEGISDEYLEKVYAASACLIAASYDEGFGLPLIEAAQHKLPIIARNIPVFREVAGEHALYFDVATPDGLAQSIKIWLALRESGQYPKSDDIPLLTWKESAQQLLAVLEINRPQSISSTENT